MRFNTYADTTTSDSSKADRYKNLTDTDTMRILTEHNKPDLKQLFMKKELNLKLVHDSEHPLDVNGNPLLFLEESCCVCMNELKWVAVYKCGHCVCEGCFVHMAKDNTVKCVMCRSEESQIGNVYIYNTDANNVVQNEHRSWVDRLAKYATNIEYTKPSKHTLNFGTSSKIQCAPFKIDESQFHIVKIMPPEIPSTKAFVVLFDCSYSFHESIGILHKNSCLKEFVDNICGNYLSFVTFSDTSSVILNPVYIDSENKLEIVQKLTDGIYPQMTTNLADGISTVIEDVIPTFQQLLLDSSITTTIEVVIVTDGVADDVGSATEKFQTLSSLSELSPVTASIIGSGCSYDYNVCDQIVMQDTTKFTHVTDEQDIFRNISQRNPASVVKLPTLSCSTMLFNGSVYTSSDHHIATIQQYPGMICIENANINQIKIDGVPVLPIFNYELQFDAKQNMLSTVFIERIKQLSLNTEVVHLFENLQKLALLTNTLREYRHDLRYSYQEIATLIETQRQHLNEQTRRFDSLNYTADLRLKSNDIARATTATIYRTCTQILQDNRM